MKNGVKLYKTRLIMARVRYPQLAITVSNIRWCLESLQLRKDVCNLFISILNLGSLKKHWRGVRKLEMLIGKIWCIWEKPKQGPRNINLGKIMRFLCQPRKDAIYNTQWFEGDMQAGLSFWKDFPIPQLYKDRIIIPEVSKGRSTLLPPCHQHRDFNNAKITTK